MKKYIKDFTVGETIEKEVFGIKEFQKHKTKKGDNYYRLTLIDKTGEVKGNIWGSAFDQCTLTNVKPGSVVEVNAIVEEFNGALQFNIYKLVPTENYDLSDILKASTHNLDELFTQITTRIDQLENADLKSFLQTIFSDEDIASRYRRSPAGEFVHHDFVGGLMEHTLEMLSIADATMKFYPEANKDLVTAGIILHDMGKIWELEINGTAIKRTTQGYLISHIPLMIEFLTQNRPDYFPDELWMKLIHIIISHHGEIEFGAVVRPGIIEAAIVHSADKTSSYVRQYQKLIQEHDGSTQDFSNYQKWIGTQIYLK